MLKYVENQTGGTGLYRWAFCTAQLQGSLFLQRGIARSMNAKSLLCENNVIMHNVDVFFQSPAGTIVVLTSHTCM